MPTIRISEAVAKRLGEHSVGRYLEPKYENGFADIEVADDVYDALDKACHEQCCTVEEVIKKLIY